MQISSLTAGPYRKIVRAEELFTDAQTRLETWAENNPVTSQFVLSEDRQRIDLILSVAAEPPLEDISLVIGDALHNLRSALDGLVWNLAHVDRAPERPRDVQFPVTVTQKQWKEAAKKLPTVPPSALEKIREFQCLDDAPGISFVKVLHDLDIRDKHHDFLTAYGQVLAIDIDNLTVHVDAPTTIFPIETNARLTTIDGATLASLRFSEPLRRGIDPGGESRFGMTYAVDVAGGHVLTSADLAASFPATTRAIIGAICDGLEGGI